MDGSTTCFGVVHDRVPVFVPSTIGVLLSTVAGAPRTAASEERDVGA